MLLIYETNTVCLKTDVCSFRKKTSLLLLSLFSVQWRLNKILNYNQLILLDLCVKGDHYRHRIPQRSTSTYSHSLFLHILAPPRWLVLLQLSNGIVGSHCCYVGILWQVAAKFQIKILASLGQTTSPWCRDQLCNYIHYHFYCYSNITGSIAFANTAWSLFQPDVWPFVFLVNPESLGE